MKAHLVDGTYELFRAFFGAPSAADRNGREVGATRGLMRSMASLLDEPGVTHVAAAFDTVIESFRNELYAGYKTGVGLPRELTEQFPLVERALLAMGITVWSMIEFEADDALATAAHQLAQEPEVEQVVLCSPDKDLTQCVLGERVVALDRMRKRVLDEAKVVEKFGVSPASIPDWLALVGDAADGYPGIPRWGAKSAAVVLRHYQHLENIPAHASDWQVKVRGAAVLAENLSGKRQDAELFRTLATLRKDVPIDASRQALLWRGPTPELAIVSEELGMGPGLGAELERRARRARV